MTQINLVPPEELTDQHLFAEFREIKMVPKALSRSIAAALRRAAALPQSVGAEARVQWALDHVLLKVPPAFTLNKGHVSFFYDKGAYLHERFNQLCEELSIRGYGYDNEAVLDSSGVYASLPDAFNNQYIPTPDALALVRERIAQQIALKPDWYRHTKPMR